MRNPLIPLGWTLGVLLGTGCTLDRGQAARADSTLLAQRETRFAGHLDGAQSEPGRLLARWELPHALREISGLALTPEGQLLAHDDNLARIYAIDYRRGVVTKEFAVGEALLQGDFEAIAAGRGQLFLVTSDGTLYRFEEGEDGRQVSYDEIDTGLGKSCEIEAMAYEGSTGSLVFGCKRVYDKDLEDRLVLYRWGLPRGEPHSVLTVPFDRIVGSRGWKGAHPTDMAIDPRSGHFVILLKENAVLELTPEGQVVAVWELPDAFQQPEGLAISPEGIVMISDESGQRPASITLYRGFAGVGRQ